MAGPQALDDLPDCRRNHIRADARPAGAGVRGSVWYLVASREGQLRSYRVSRVREAKVLAQPSDRPADFDLETYWRRARDEYRAQIPSYAVWVRIREQALARANPASHWGRLESTRLLAAGWLEARVVFEFEEYALSWVLSAGAAVEVLEPTELRQRVTATLREALEQYQAGPG